MENSYCDGSDKGDNSRDNGDYCDSGNKSKSSDFCDGGDNGDYTVVMESTMTG